MQKFNRIMLVAALLGAGLSLSCGDAPPPAAPLAPVTSLLDDAVETTTTTVKGLLYCPHSTSYRAEKLIGPAGGSVKVGPHSLSVPSGAVSAPVLITADAPAGDYVLVHFEPAGLKFARKPTLSLSYSECGLLSVALSIVYTDDDLNILEILSSTTNLLTKTVSAKIKHFSNYALAD